MSTQLGTGGVCSGETLTTKPMPITLQQDKNKQAWRVSTELTGHGTGEARLLAAWLLGEACTTKTIN